MRSTKGFLFAFASLASPLEGSVPFPCPFAPPYPFPFPLGIQDWCVSGFGENDGDAEPASEVEASEAYREGPANGVGKFIILLWGSCAVFCAVFTHTDTTRHRVRRVIEPFPCRND